MKVWNVVNARPSNLLLHHASSLCIRCSVYGLHILISRSDLQHVDTVYAQLAERQSETSSENAAAAGVTAANVLSTRYESSLRPTNMYSPVYHALCLTLSDICCQL